MEQIMIREALPEDAEAVLACLKQVGGETDNLTFGSEGLPFTAEQERIFLQEQQASDHGVFLCAWDGPHLVGTASLQPLPRRMYHRAELGISVVKAYWGRGIGSQLLEQVIAYAKTHSIELLNLEVRSDNARAIHLYEKYGFRSIGISPAFFKIGSQYADCVLMYLDLR